uniref:Uncharacterized protein n=1 Tax=Myotis myotis TaxID=51298 RepID=A0A7J7U5Q2_MYOMY|nr:hypothetical protein mMyoMyo1_008894 [Myotis myotis]
MVPFSQQGTPFNEPSFSFSNQTNKLITMKTKHKTSISNYRSEACGFPVPASQECGEAPGLADLPRRRPPASARRMSCCPAHSVLRAASAPSSAAPTASLQNSRPRPTRTASQGELGPFGFIGEKIEAQNGNLSCLTSHNSQVVEHRPMNREVTV